MYGFVSMGLSYVEVDLGVIFFWDCCGFIYISFLRFFMVLIIFDMF